MKSCCGGLGFVKKTGDYKSHSGTVYKDIEYVARCPEYKRYFDDLEALSDRPVWSDTVCSAASKAHQAHIDRGKKGGKKSSY